MYWKSTENWTERLKEQDFGSVPFFMETHVKPNKLRNMATPTFQQLVKRIDELREDIQFFDTQKKYLAHSDPKEKNSLKEYQITLRLKAEFLLETINNL